MLVGNGLDRSGIGVFTAMLYKIRIGYNIHRLEPEQASLFPTTSFYVTVKRRQPKLFFLLYSGVAAPSPLFTLHSSL